MKSPALPFALRQLQAHFSQRGTWVGIAIVGGVLGLVGPFGTYGSIPVLPRLGYWLVVALTSYATGYGCGALLAAALPELLQPKWLRIALIGLLSGVPIALLVAALNWLVLGPAGSGLADLTTLLLYCPLISLAVTAALWLLPTGRNPAPAPVVPATPALLTRLSLPQRGKLLALSVSDHYVDVITDRGTTLLLLRLGDAIRETAPIEGVQIHRSHWVALGAVKTVGRSEGRAWVELENGQRLPVSRGYMAAARHAGLLV